MGEPTNVLIDRAIRRAEWLVEPSSRANGEDRYRICSSAQELVADGLHRERAVEMADAYNAARADAAALASDLRDD